MKITPDQEKTLIIDILTKLNVPEEQSKIVADVTVDGDLKGFSSHGIGRFPQYVTGIQEGNIKVDADIEIENDNPSSALINGNHIFGHYVAYSAMKLAIEKAKETGVAVVGVHDSNHFGVTGYYSDMAAMEDLIGVVIANTEPAMAPSGGKTPILGTNPVAISIPSNKNYITLDMATSSTARGKLLECSRKGEPIPEGLALDCEGNPTTDPDEALKGSILPFGTHKGYGLAFMIEILAGPLVKAAYGSKVTGTANCKETCTKGDLMLAIDPSKLVDIDAFKENVDDLINELKQDGDHIITPGDIEVNNIKKHETEGIDIDDVLAEQLTKIANELDINIEGILS